MSLLKYQKTLVVNEIKERINNSQSIVVAKYQGLTVKQIQNLRKIAKEKDVKIKVYKNHLVKKAIESTEFSLLSDDLVGANMYAFSFSDSISAAKVLFEFAKTNKQVELVAGIVENKVLNKTEIENVAKLPSYEEALTMLASSLQGAIKQIAIGLRILIDENHIKN